MIAALTIVLSISFVWWSGVHDPSPEAGEYQVIVPKDSLKNLGFTIEEQNSTIEELNGLIDNLKAELETMPTDSTEIKPADTDM